MNRIAHIISTLGTGGAEKLIIDSLPEYNNTVETDLIVLKDIGDKSIFKEKLEKEFDGNIIYLTKKSLYNPILIFRIGRLLSMYDLVHVHLFPTLYWVALAKLLFFSRVKLVYTEHSTSNKRRNRLLFRYIDRFIYSKYNCIGTISFDSKKMLENHLNTSNIKVIPNGINRKKFVIDDNLKMDYTFFNEESFVLIQVSRFSSEKDQDTLVRSLSLLPEKFKLLLVGDGIRKREVMNLVSQLKLENRVLFLGNRTDISSLLNYSDVNVLSSNVEGFGLAIVEGMSMKKPSIASDIVGLREIVDGYGLLFEKGNETKLANIILNLENNSAYYNTIAEKCLERSKKYDINIMITNYLDIYKKLLEK